MDEIHLNNLDLYRYNRECQAHNDFVDLLMQDADIINSAGNVREKLSGLYLPGQIWENGFLVGKQEDLLGYVYLYRHSFSTRIATMNYAVQRDFRGNGYGSMILQEVGDFIFENQKIIDLIALIINNLNVNSIDAAKRAGFIKQEMFYVRGRI